MPVIVLCRKAQVPRSRKKVKEKEIVEKKGKDSLNNLLWLPMLSAYEFFLRFTYVYIYAYLHEFICIMGMQVPAEDRQ